MRSCASTNTTRLLPHQRQNGIWTFEHIIIINQTMRRCAQIARILPLALLLCLSVAVQALVMSKPGHAGAPSAFGDFHTMILCAEGKLREVTIDANGDPVEDKHDRSNHCPICLAGGKLFVQQPAFVIEQITRSVRALEFSNAATAAPVSSKPDRLDCLDPPGNA